MNWKEFVKETPAKISAPRRAAKVSNSYYENKGSLTLYGWFA